VDFWIPPRDHRSTKPCDKRILSKTEMGSRKAEISQMGRELDGISDWDLKPEGYLA
jgi:hypothetical protein